MVEVISGCINKNEGKSILYSLVFVNLTEWANNKKKNTSEANIKCTLELDIHA